MGSMVRRSAFSVTSERPERPEDDRMRQGEPETIPPADSIEEQRNRELSRSDQEVASQIEQLARKLEGLCDAVPVLGQDRAALVGELGTLRGMLESFNHERVELRLQSEHLQRELAKQQLAAERDRTFLVEQQDQFLASLLDEHERETQVLRDECDRAWLRVRELEAVAKRVARQSGPLDLRGVAMPFSSEERGLAREALLLAKQQRDEAQRQTLDALKRLGDTSEELARLRASLAPSTIPPSYPLPASLSPGGGTSVPPAPHSQEDAMPASSRTSAPGWKRSIPPAARPWSSSTQETLPPSAGASTPSPESAPFATASAQASAQRAGSAARDLMRSDLPMPTPAEPRPGQAIHEPSHSLPESASRIAVAAQPLRRKPDPVRQSIGSYSITEDSSEFDTAKPSSR